MFKNMSLKIKIFFLVTLVVIVSFLAVVWVGYANTLKVVKKDAFDLAQETAEKYKNEIKAELQGARVAASTLATVFETLKRHELTDRETMNDIIRSVLEKKDFITAFCVVYEPDALDGKDSLYAGQKPVYNATGRYSPYWNKLDGDIRVQPLDDADIVGWYAITKKTGREYITDPYPYFVQGRQVMLASMVFPIVHEGGVIGVVAADIVLDKLQEMVTRVNPRSRGGFTEIISNSGIVVANPDDRYLGKDLAETMTYDSLRANPGQAAAAVRALENRTDEQSEKLLDNLKAYAAKPNRAKPDISLFTPELSGEILESSDAFAATGSHLSRVKEAVGSGHSLIAREGDNYTVYMPIHFSDVTRPWSVAVNVPMREVLRNADGVRRYVTAMSILAVCVIALILYLIARSVTWPLLVLAESAERIGEGDVTTQIPRVGGGKEIGALAGALRFMAGKNEELIGELQDYADQLEEKNQYLNRLNELKDEFLANTSHELRTPIHGIIGIADSMIDGSTGPLTREQEYNLAIITNSGRRLSNMINDILDFTKLKNREITLHPKPVDLKTIADTVLFLSRPLVKGKELRLENGIDDCFPPVEADENRIQQILYNLIGNAVRFTEKGVVRVSAEVRDGMAAVSVSDTGIGIPGDKLDKVFESFEQVDGSAAREYGGTGLGLPITKKLVELHGGGISLESEVGAGSSFTFTMPLSNKGEGAICKLPRPEAAIDLEQYSSDDLFDNELSGNDLSGSGAPVETGDQPHRILAVDDEPVNIQVLRNLLRMRNCLVTSAHSGAEALRLLESGEQFDLVLLDVMMPKMSGYEVCRRLRQKHSLFELPILMLTAKNRLHDIVLGFQSGANDYLSKPFDREELLARVQTLLSLKQAVRTAIHNERLFENEKQMRVLEQTLLEVTNAITSTLDLKEVLAKVLDAMSHFIHFSKSAVVLNDEEVEERFEVAVVGGGVSAAVHEGAALSVPGDEFLEKAAASGRIVVGNDLASAFHDWRVDGETLVGVPMLSHDVLLGFIVLSCPEGEISRELLFTLAGQAGVAIQNARLFTKINIMATTDGLTGLYNRRHFFELVEKEHAKHRRLGTPLSVCMMDIDFFKRVNDVYGHAIGDDVLRHLAGKLKELVREYDIVGRYGGEEFAVVFPETPVEVATKIVDRIRSVIEKSAVQTEEFGPIHYTLSMGVSAFPPDGGTISATFDEADKCLYEAKNSGRNRVVAKT